MGALFLDPRLSLGSCRSQPHQRREPVEEIKGLLKVYQDGSVERFPVIPLVSCVASSDGVTSKDVVIDDSSDLWARIYSPNVPGKLPLMVYFHGGGFCVGSAAWSCYHEFLANLALRAKCVVVSVNYRLAPENRLPAPYEDGVRTVVWIGQQALGGCNEHRWWLSQCNVSDTFLAGDSAGANIAHNVSLLISDRIITKVRIKGIVLIQPFFGGEARTNSEMTNTAVNPVLTLSASDTYWRLSLPPGANRDHPWCNPQATMAVPRVMVCVSETDILKDRNLQYIEAASKTGRRVEAAVYAGVGHGFQILNKSQLASTRTHEMISNIRDFINQ
ncbi:hypothetical protein MLD38_024558 [Melastoma candidum]|uniref:Uncharacterized protein n=1 Tax=Melastoma candidum TaxID=119954 RepID=A0ACB9NUD5_9MYRT|nr:hypothetical protein MLD38_024558 [Melastoma candidum]